MISKHWNNYREYLWFCDFSQQSQFLIVYRRFKNSVFTFHFDTNLSSLMMWNLQSYPTTVVNERMWYFRGPKHTLTPPTYFQGSNPPTRRIGFWYCLNKHELTVKRSWISASWYASVPKSNQLLLVTHSSTRKKITRIRRQLFESSCRETDGSQTNTQRQKHKHCGGGN